MRQFEYTYWGSPVVAQVLNVFSPLTLSDKFYSYNASIGVNKLGFRKSSKRDDARKRLCN